MNQNSDFESLRQASDAKYDELCAHIAERLGLATDPANLSADDCTMVSDLADEAVENFEKVVFGGWSLEKPKLRLQRLLAEFIDLQLSVFELGRRWR